MGAGYCRGCHSIRSGLLSAFDHILTWAAGMQTFIVIQGFSLRGQSVVVGQHVQLTPLQATQCISLGLVKPVAVQEPEQPGIDQTPVQEAKPKKRR